MSIKCWKLTWKPAWKKPFGLHPSRKFVQTVRGRMRSLAPSVVVAGRIDETPRFWLLMGGLVSGALLLAAAARAVFYVLNRSKM